MKREQYIPFDKDFLVEKQQEIFYTNKEQEAEKFKKLFEILEHYFHYEAFRFVREIKQNYAYYDPDIEEQERKSHYKTSKYSIFIHSITQLLKRSKYSRVAPEVLEEALKDSDLIGLDLSIDFEAYQDYQLYVRGRHTAIEKVSKNICWKKTVEIEYYERVLILLHYKEKAYFSKKNRKKNKQPLEPGSIQVKIFKRVPVNDLETVFPNAQPRMSTTDKLLFWIPAIGGGISLLSTKVIPALIGMYGAYKSGEAIDLLNSKTSLNHGLIALGVLGAYLFRQYSSFINKKIKYAKMLSDSLYFKNLGNNSGAFHSLINTSEEEELKETMLAYSFLNQSINPLSSDELDKKIECWMQKEFGADIDFDVEEALHKLQKTGIGKEENGSWTVLPLDEALKQVDALWDSIFTYNN